MIALDERELAERTNNKIMSTMCDHQVEENTEYWLKKSEEWTSSSRHDTRVKKDVSCHVSRLTLFLRTLRDLLTSIVSLTSKFQVGIWSLVSGRSLQQARLAGPGRASILSAVVHVFWAGALWAECYFFFYVDQKGLEITGRHS